MPERVNEFGCCVQRAALLFAVGWTERCRVGSADAGRVRGGEMWRLAAALQRSSDKRELIAPL